MAATSSGVITGLVGSSVTRVEDQRILRGKGRYIDDVKLPGMLHAAFLRSPHAHARITRIDTAKAKQLPGVVAVLTAADLQGVANPMALAPTPDLETRGAVASYNQATDELLFHGAVQAPQVVRFFLATLLNVPVHRVRVINGDIGGAFGLKAGVYREDVAVAAASKILGRPVKWIEDRVEHLMASGHAREETAEVEAAVKNDGTLLGLKVSLIMDQGAYPLLPFAAFLFGQLARVHMPGPYRFQNFRFEL